ncbi:RHS repeat domain-containing protein [Pedobacter yonginense]|uniref:RHS repeat domain-containing protein n=1 Tax=Pedobacter yonginense TaxID=651869 RepID=UPI001F0C0C98|nr:RHS repeat-associated core domain-containing protein [Pedobacter yonginense]
MSAAGTVDYVDGIQYKTGNIIDFVQTEEGIARNSNGNYTYEYNLSDHLGNVRATFYKNPNTQLLEVLQRDNYYAFGLRKSAVFGNNKYLYNGKEIQEELGEYDYGARFYDPVIGRWNVVDPLAEKYNSHSPYNYGLNDPVGKLDPNGMWVETAKGYTTSNAEEIAAFLGKSSAPQNEEQEKDPPKKKKDSYTSSFYKQLIASDPFSNGNIGATWERWLSSESTLGTDLLNGLSQTMLNVGSLFWTETYVGQYNDTKAYLAMSPEDRAKVDAKYLNSFIEGAATYAPLAYAGGELLNAKHITQLQSSDFIRTGNTVISNQLVEGKGALGSRVVKAVKGGGYNRKTGASLPYHFHVHMYNWGKPNLWFKETPILKIKK